ncbi:MAG TPA: septum formation initiator family protein [Candidatus Paceibacterota bacterium]|nr:septum formation initiator family protein [Candidatus Paceibacterota bacterium]
MTISLMFVLAAALSVSTYDRYVAARETGAKLEEREAELAVLKERAAALEAQVKHLENDRGIEEELRSRYDVVRQGEEAVILVGGERDAKARDDAGILVTKEATETPSFFERLRSW